MKERREQKQLQQPLERLKYRIPFPFPWDEIKSMISQLPKEESQEFENKFMAANKQAATYLLQPLEVNLVMPPQISPKPDGLCIFCHLPFSEHRHWFWFVKGEHVNAVNIFINRLKGRHHKLQDLVFKMKDAIDPSIVPSVRERLALISRHVERYDVSSPVWIALDHLFMKWHIPDEFYQFLHYFIVGIPLQNCENNYDWFTSWAEREFHRHDDDPESFEKSHGAICAERYSWFRKDFEMLENLIIGFEALMESWKEYETSGYRQLVRVAAEKEKLKEA